MMHSAYRPLTINNMVILYHVPAPPPVTFGRIYPPLHRGTEPRGHSGLMDETQLRDWLGSAQTAG